jgi:hypothetical protein
LLIVAFAQFAGLVAKVASDSHHWSVALVGEVLVVDAGDLVVQVETIHVGIVD